MVNDSFYNTFAKIFANNSIDLLVKNFNAQVGNNGFNSVRAAYDSALIDEFLRRGIDVSVIYDGTVTSFQNEIRFDEERLRLVIIE